MLMSIANQHDPALARLEASVLVEHALGEDRRATAFRLVSLALGVLSEVDRHGTPARVLATRLHALADDLEG